MPAQGFLNSRDMLLPHFTALGAGPIVLMLHGAGGNFRSFAPQVERLARAGYKAVAWDMPGYGHSVPVEPYGLKGLARSAIALIEALLPADAPAPKRSVHLVGHGLGGMVAQELIMRRPDLVRRLVLVGSTSGPDSGWAEDAVSQTLLLDAAADADRPQWAQTVVAAQTGPQALAEGVMLANHCMAQVSPVTYRHALQAQAAFDRDAALSHIHVPTLLIRGEHDPLAPMAALERMAQRIHGGRWVQMPGVGHWPQLESPEAFEALLLDFLDEAPVHWTH
jgi:pimeloyl-ACP methyl ester carboxylesterase